MSSSESLHEKFVRLRQSVKSGYIKGASHAKKRKSSDISAGPEPASVEQDNKSVKVDKGFLGPLQHYEDAIEKSKLDREEKDRDFLTFKEKVEDLRAAYLFGLKQVSALKDLQDAPDAILFGNFPRDATRNKN
eukprot:scaffold1328_cov162-Amphora_coffeaeformis.AAC.12